jgi:hypothetical protein
MRRATTPEERKLLDNKQLAEWTGWGNTDATAAMNCPKCGAVAGRSCKMPSGKKARFPHAERGMALHRTGYNANRVVVRDHRTLGLV